MSNITSMVLITGPGEEDAVAELNAWCREHDADCHQEFRRLDPDAAGGMKVLTVDVWAMAGNYFPWTDLVNALGEFEWHWPEDVVLVVDHEPTNQHAVFRVGDRVDQT
jgi:hypothetical protein